MRLKTTTDNLYAQKFYELNGMQKIRTEQGKKRELVVFEKGFNLSLKNKSKLKIK